MEIIIQQAQGSSQSIIFKLKMGARDSSFINKVTYLAKWLIQSLTTFIISKIMHSFSIKRFMQKSVPNASRSLTIKVHTLTGLWLMITFTIYLSNKLTISPTSLIHVLSLLIAAYLFKVCDLTSQFTRVMESINFKVIHKHRNFKTNITTA